MQWGNNKRGEGEWSCGEETEQLNKNSYVRELYIRFNVCKTKGNKRGFVNCKPF